MHLKYFNSDIFIVFNKATSVWVQEGAESRLKWETGTNPWEVYFTEGKRSSSYPV